MNILLVACGGFFGSIARFYLSFILNKHLLGTWLANLAGSILLGVLVTQHIGHTLPEWLWMLLGIGFCGAFTTFSTFGNETLELILEKKYIAALGYVLSSVMLIVIVIYGMFIFRF